MQLSEYKRRWICTLPRRSDFIIFTFCSCTLGICENNPFSPLNPDLFVQRCTLPNISIKCSAFLSAHITNWDINYRYAPLLLIRAWCGGKDSGCRFSGLLRSAADTVSACTFRCKSDIQIFLFCSPLSLCLVRAKREMIVASHAFTVP